MKRLGTLPQISLFLFMIFVASLPLWLPTYQITVATQILIYAIFALGLNVLVGFGGLISLGHGALFAISAYTAAVLLGMGYPHLLAIPAALFMTLLATAVCALLSLRATGIGFLMITLAFGEVVWGLAYRWIEITNGDNGVSVAARPAPFGISLASSGRFFYATFLVFLVVLLVTYLFVNSPFGVSLKGTRDEPRRMSALGYHVWAIRFCAFLFSGLITGVAGLLFLYQTQFISPQAANLPASAEALLMVISGGAGTLAGPVVGSAIIMLMENVASDYIERWNSVLGALFIVIVLFVPEGVVPGAIRLFRAVASRLNAEAGTGDGGVG